jgi:hypothetical protein
MSAGAGFMGFMWAIAGGGKYATVREKDRHAINLCDVLK